jgi:hypothetical protein
MRPFDRRLANMRFPFGSASVTADAAAHVKTGDLETRKIPLLTTSSSNSTERGIQSADSVDLK